MGERSLHFQLNRNKFTNVTLRSIVATAYGIKEYQIEGPEWLTTARYDIVAKAAMGTAEKDLPAMLRALLADRFKLQTHLETKELAVYGLVVAKSGFKLKPVETGSSGRDTNHTAMGGELTATKTSMNQLAQWLSRSTDRPVVDMTGIDGVFDFTVKYSIERENRSNEANETPKYPIVPLAIQEQLGLRLEKRTANLEVLSLDRVDKTPVEN